MFVEQFNASVSGAPANYVSAVALEHHLSGCFVYQHHQLTGDGELAGDGDRVAEVSSCHAPGECPTTLQVSMSLWCAALLLLPSQRDETESDGGGRVHWRGRDKVLHQRLQMFLSAARCHGNKLLRPVHGMLSVDDLR